MILLCDEDIESVYIEIGMDQLHSSGDIIIGVILATW